MPVLRKEPSLYPENLLDGPSWQEADRRWMVLYTKPRQEKAVSRELLHRQVPFYLPLVRKNHQYRGRRLASHVPLFDGYIFLFGARGRAGQNPGHQPGSAGLGRG